MQFILMIILVLLFKAFNSKQSKSIKINSFVFKIIHDNVCIKGIVLQIHCLVQN